MLLGEHAVLHGQRAMVCAIDRRITVTLTLRADRQIQIDATMMSHAKPDAIFMNCLPACRGAEQTAEVIDGPQSVVFDEAENRMHAQKAVVLTLYREANA
jgi:ornithine carbamoyltransferase